MRGLIIAVVLTIAETGLLLGIALIAKLDMDIILENWPTFGLTLCVLAFVNIAIWGN